jgi:hypothetical protein
MTLLAQYPRASPSKTELELKDTFQDLRVFGLIVALQKHYPAQQITTADVKA